MNPVYRRFTVSRLYIIAAPSGGGKTSLVRALVEQMPDLVISVSHTTRPKREGEIDGVNYYFISELLFKDYIQKNIFLEYACVFGHWYGTSREWVLSQLNNPTKNKSVILEIDWQGAQQIRALFKESLSIFILPPSMDILHQRLVLRGQDSEAVIQKRMQAAEEECAHANEFDHVIINDDFNTALENLKNIILNEQSIT